MSAVCFGCETVTATAAAEGEKQRQGARVVVAVFCSRSVKCPAKMNGSRCCGEERMPQPLMRQMIEILWSDCHEVRVHA